MSSSQQQGSVHVIVTIVAVIGLVAALGFIFWQNFLGNKDEHDSTKQTNAITKTEQKKAVALKTATFDPSFGNQLSFEYPEDWTVDRTKTGLFPLNVEVSASSEVLTVESPDKSVRVRYAMGAGGGRGGMCLEEEAATIAQLDYEELAEFAGASATEIVSKLNGAYTFESALYKTDVVAKTKAGDTECGTLGYAFFVINERNYVELLGASIALASLNSEQNVPKSFESIEQIEAQLKSDEYKLAKKILLSTKVLQ